MGLQCRLARGADRGPSRRPEVDVLIQDLVSDRHGEEDEHDDDGERPANDRGSRHGPFSAEDTCLKLRCGMPLLHTGRREIMLKLPTSPSRQLTIKPISIFSLLPV